MIIISLLTVDKIQYKIEVQPDTTIGQLKEASSKEFAKCDPKKIKLIYKKNILKDDVQISSLNLKENDFIVIYIPKCPRNKNPSESTTSNSNDLKPSDAEQSKPQTPPSQNRPQAAKPIEDPIPSSINNVPPYNPLPANFIQNPNINVSSFMQRYPQAFNALSNIGRNQPNSMIRRPSPFDIGVSRFEFNRKVEQLKEMSGSPFDDCEKALYAAKGNIERAAEYLLNENYDQSDSTFGQESYRDQIHQLDSEFREVFRRALQIEPRLLENFVSEFQYKNPAFRTNPELLLHYFGLTEEGFDIDGIRNYRVIRVEPSYFDVILNMAQQQIHCPNFQSCISPMKERQLREEEKEESGQNKKIKLADLSEDEKNAVLRIKQIGNFSIQEVIDVYIACDKDEEKAANVLLSK